jgi:hypothetical protein
VEFVEKVDPELKREKKADDTVSDHGLVNCQEGQCLPKALGANSESPFEAKRLTMRAALNVQALINNLVKRRR